jgi:hemerythrin superfamily protein
VTTAGNERSVIDLLLEQHQEIKQLFERLKHGGGNKQELFDQLVRLLAVHESAEEQVVHPAARRTEAGDRVVDKRLHEEGEAKHELAKLYDMGVDHPEFDEKLANLAHAVVSHATAEETEEFSALLRESSPEALQRMAGAVRAAQAVAPTRPHPRAGESALANMIAGPPLAVYDRARDAVRNWFKTHQHQ